MNDIAPTKKLETSRDQNGVIQPLLTDLYAITMAYAYWKSGRHRDRASFDLLFRKNPFQGEFTIFAGLEECLKFLRNFHYSEPDMQYIRKVLSPDTEEEFFSYLGKLDTTEITVYSVDEGTVVFPKVPLMRIEGPLLVAQLLETTILNLINYASLVATNAARFRLAAGPGKSLLEFGLRRAQGPDGGLSASRYCYIGGFDGTSNVLAGKLFGIPVKGTQAHAFINAYNSASDIDERVLASADGSNRIDLVESSLHWREKLAPVLGYIPSQTSEGELAAFVAYALAFPKDVLCLIDTYDVIRSGLPNFCSVALALDQLRYRAIGVRLDSGDLAYLSSYVRQSFKKIADKFDVPWFKDMQIVASNDINEDTIHSLNNQKHSIDCFGIGTHLVTCQKQPALGCVYKIAEVNGKPCMKLSADVDKVTMPGRKNAYRLFGTDGLALVDLLQQLDEPPVTEGRKILCRHPFQETKRAYVVPSKVKALYRCYFENGEICQPLPSLKELRD